MTNTPANPEILPAALFLLHYFGRLTPLQLSQKLEGWRSPDQIATVLEAEASGNWRAPAVRLMDLPANDNNRPRLERVYVACRW